MSEKVIQFGEGGFLRGFADWMLQIVNDQTDFNGSVVVVQPIKEGLCQKLSSQGCQYTHICRGTDFMDIKKINVISRCVEPYKDFEAYLALAENPDFRFIISNTTEAGICVSDRDKFNDKPAASFPGKLTQLLYRRHQLNLPGFIILPCELIDKNGEMLRDCVLRTAERWGLPDEFRSFVEEENIFCNTLVDRINTGYPAGEYIDLGYEDAMLNTSEDFHLWVIDGYDKLFSEIPFDKCGLNVILTDCLEKYRTRKVRILNGAHTSLVAYGLLSGFETVRECVSDAVMREHIRKCVYDEIIPTLDLPKEELIDYADSVLQRFANPYINHRLASISLNSVSKFRVRVLPSILEYIKRFGKVPPALIFSFAKLLELYRTDMVNDAEDIKAFMKSASLADILSNKELWGTDLSFLVKEIENYANR